MTTLQFMGSFVKSIQDFTTLLLSAYISHIQLVKNYARHIFLIKTVENVFFVYKNNMQVACRYGSLSLPMQKSAWSPTARNKPQSGYTWKSL